MPTFEVIWNRRQLEWRSHPKDAPWMVEAILLERVLLAGRPQLKIVCRLAAIDEDHVADTAAAEAFWTAARRRLGKLYRLSARDRDAIEALLIKRVPRPVPAVAAGLPACAGAER